ncbi:MAG: NYN domain-containing protein [Candidatus Omnitrophota bacterium]|nr:NYN domain-containing protein [Candidatus Omnitrophota bacterium]
MSLLFVIDGYNVLNHSAFNRKRNASHGPPPQAIQSLIREKRLTGSLKNKVILVFDGYPAQGEPAGGYSGINLIYSRKVSADEIIKQIVEESASRGNIVVVSDDKEIKFMARFLRAGHMGVEEFIGAKERAPHQEEPLSKPELNYSQAHKINEELKKLWL